MTVSRVVSLIPSSPIPVFLWAPRVRHCPSPLPRQRHEQLRRTLDVVWPPAVWGHGNGSAPHASSLATCRSGHDLIKAMRFTSRLKGLKTV